MNTSKRTLMISLFHARCSTILSRSGYLFTKIPSCGYSHPSRITSFPNSGDRTVNLGMFLTKFQSRCYSSKKSSGGSSRKRKVDNEPIMKDKEEFFVVRKGDLLGVYKSLSDCQAQVGTSPYVILLSVCSKVATCPRTEKYLVSCGLKNALHTIRASDLTEGLFGPLVSCPAQDGIMTRNNSRLSEVEAAIGVMTEEQHQLRGDLETFRQGTDTKLAEILAALAALQATGSGNRLIPGG
ncbi:hypothetical protein OROHE_015719 [Orobanche hederae]